VTASPSADVRRAATRFIVWLGIVSLFADMTYEGARSIIGPFLSEFGATAMQVGFVAGFGEMVAAGLRFFTGRLADRTRAYWPLTIGGYALNLLVVPALAFTGSWQAAALLIIAERFGKSVRGPARDVLLSEATQEVGHGWGFGLHTALDQTGAVLGPLVVAAVVARSQHFATGFLILAVPALAAIVALVLARITHPSRGAPPPAPISQQSLPRVFWAYCAVAGLMACGFVDFALLAYHLEKTALVSAPTIPLFYAGAMAVNGAAALLFGRLFDRYGIAVLSAGIFVSVFALPLGFLGGPGAVAVAVTCWGIGLGAADATLRPGIARVVSMHKRGTAFGSFNGVYGVLWFVGSVIMGRLYDHSIVALVLFGVILKVVAAAGFLVLRRGLAGATIP
jgi:MFS family permease